MGRCLFLGLCLLTETYQCLKSTGFATRVRSEELQCGDIVHLTLDDILYLSTPHSGPGTVSSHGEPCTWTIISPATTKIKITFQQFELWYHPTCAIDYVTISNGNCDSEHSDDPRFCGVVPPPMSISTENVICLKFSSKMYTTQKGFSLKAESISAKGTEGAETNTSEINTPKNICEESEIKVKTEIQLASPLGEDGKYPVNLKCGVHVYATNGKRLSIQVIKFHIEYHQLCSWDNLTIYDGADDFAPKLETLCGTIESVPSLILSSSSQLYLNFISDHVIAQEGFLLNISTIQEGIAEDATTKASVTTEDAITKDSVTTDKPFVQSTLQTDSSSLTYLLTSYNSPSTNLLTTFNSSFGSKKLTLSASSAIRHSTTSVSSSGRLETIEMCNVTGTFQLYNDTFVTSPNFGDNQKYPVITTCTLTFSTSTGYKMKIEFIHFDIEGNSLCSWDSLQVFDGTDDTTKTKRNLCGTSLPDSFISAGNELFFKFVSDIIIPKSGFKAKINLIKAEVNTERTSTAPSHANTNLVSSAVTELSTLSWDSRSILRNASLASLLSTTTKKSPSASVVRTNSTTGTVQISFTPSTQASLFSVLSTFSSAVATILPKVVEMCNTTGIITVRGKFLHLTSPGFGEYNMYPTSIQCTVSLQANIGSKLEIVFLHFDVEGNSLCSWDSLQIFDGANDTGTLLGKLCGSSLPAPLASTGRYLFLKFVSDHIITKTGFKAKINLVQGMDDNSTTQSGTTTSAQSATPKLTTGTLSSLSDDTFFHTLYSSMSSTYHTKVVSASTFSSTTIITADTSSLSLTSVLSSQTELIDMCSIEKFTIYKSIMVLSPKDTDTGMYPRSITCGLTITSKTSTLHIEFEQFDVEYQQYCQWDYLEIYDGPSAESPLKSRYCGSEIPSSIQTSGKEVYFRFQSDHVIPKSGFRLKVSLMINSSGLDEETASEFTQEYSTVYSTLSSANPQSTEMSSSNEPSTTATPSQFSMEPSSTTATSQSDEFTAPSLVSINICSRDKVYVTNNTTVISPNFPNNYPVDAKCGLHVSAVAGKVLSIKFIHFDLEYHSQCLWDYLSVYNGDSVSLPLIDTFCGTDLPSCVVSSTNNIFVKFVSDSFVPKSGFKFTIYVEESTNSKTRMPKIGSSSQPDSTLLSGQTSVKATQTKTTKRMFTIEKFTPSESSTAIVSNNSNKMNTSVPFSASTDITGEETKHVTTKEFVWAPTDAVNPKNHSSNDTNENIPIQATHSIQTTIGVSHTPLTTPGLALGLPQACSGGMKIRNSSGSIDSPGLQNNMQYPHSLNCTWILIGITGYRISVYFEAFELEESANCSKDSVTVYKNIIQDSNLLGRYCGLVEPFEKYTMEEKLVIHFTSDEDGSDSGFMAKYTIERSPVQNCPIGQRACKDGTCISEEWFCDSIEDCTGGEDEANCDICSDTQFQCDYNRCIAANLRCNGIHECKDKTDEDLCVSITNSNGSLRIMYENKWYPVCGDIWTTALGHTLCRAAKYREMATVSFLPLKFTATMTKFLQIDSIINIHQNIEISSQCLNASEVNLVCKESGCGTISASIRKARVVGGDRSTPGEWPWVVAIRAGEKVTCGGTLISNQWVATAGHCMASLQDSTHLASVIVGTNDVMTDDNHAVGVTEIFMHPSYEFIYNADLALLRLQRPLVTSNHVRPICLPWDRRHFTNSTLCYIAGWGITDMKDYYTTTAPEYLHHARTKIWRNSDCKKAYSSKVKDSMFCAGYNAGGIDACNGDSGGPLMCQIEDSRWILTGVTSWGEKCGQSGLPGVYTDVTFHLDWIDSVMGHIVVNVSCDFESINICGYQEMSNGSFLWTRRQGGFSSDIKPSVDATTTGVNGHYMFAEVSPGQTCSNNQAVLLSPPISGNRQKCMRFAFMFSGRSDLILGVYGHRGDYNETGLREEAELLWVMESEFSIWRRSKINLPADVTHVTFVVTLGKKTNVGVALDDVLIEPSSCEDQDDYRCSFDDGTLCKYQQATDDYLDWVLQNNAVENEYKVIPRSSRSGYYLAFGGSHIARGDRASFLSMTINDSLPHCLNMYYKIYPSLSGSLSVVLRVEFGDMHVYGDAMWDTKESRKSTWTWVAVNLPSRMYEFRVAIQGKRESYNGDFEILVDDVSIYEGNCRVT